MTLTSIFLALLFLGFGYSINAETGRVLKDTLKRGRSVEIDLFLGDYYRNRSAKSIASEIAANRFECVHYLVLDDEKINAKLIDELHKRNIGVWASVFATSVYGPRNFLPGGGKDLQMQFINQSDHALTHISFVHETYRTCMKQRLVKLFRKYPFDGFVFMETHYPVLGNLKNPEASFGDISPAFQECFKRDTNNVSFPNFTNPDDPDFYRKNTKLFKDLIEYRVKVINDFYNDIVNGENGLRANFPGLVIGTWSVALSHEGGLDFLRTWEGQDAADMVKKVKPDVHYFQTHWPDWVMPDLPPDYAKKYKPYVDSVKKVAPDIAIGLQGDIGSHDAMRKTPEWHEDFVKHSRDAGIDATTIYEYLLRWEVYHEAPSLRKSVLVEPKKIDLIFDQPIDPESAAKLSGRKITDFVSGKSYEINGIETDGNILTLTVDKSPESNRILSYPVGGVTDKPLLRFPKNPKATAPDEKYGKTNAIPEGSFAFCELEEGAYTDSKIRKP